MFVWFVILLIVGVVLILIGKSEGASEGQRKGFRISGICTLVLAGIFLLSSFFYTIEPGRVGIEVLFGKVVAQGKSGLNVKSPISSVVKLDVRTLKYETKLEGASQDQQEVMMDISLNYRLNFEKIMDLYVKVGNDYEQKIIEPAVSGLSKACISMYKVGDILIKRTNLANDIENALDARFLKYNLILETVNIKDIKFSEDYSKTIEAAQIEEKKIKTAEYVKLQAKQVAEQTIIEANATAEKNLIEARAEAKKQSLLQQSVTKDIIALKWIEKWHGDLPTVMSGGNGFMPMINLGDISKKDTNTKE